MYLHRTITHGENDERTHLWTIHRTITIDNRFKSILSDYYPEVWRKWWENTSVNRELLVIHLDHHIGERLFFPETWKMSPLPPFSKNKLTKNHPLSSVVCDQINPQLCLDGTVFSLFSIFLSFFLTGRLFIALMRTTSTQTLYFLNWWTSIKASFYVKPKQKCCKSQFSAKWAIIDITFNLQSFVLQKIFPSFSL